MAIGTTFPAGGLSKRQRFNNLRARLMSERASFDPDWRDLADHFVPRRPRFFVSDRNRGGRRSQKLIDSTPRFAARTLQSGLHAGLTSPARPWMKLTTPDARLAEAGAVKVWLHEVTRRMLTVFLQSNLYNALPIVYGDLGVFANAAVGILEDEKDLFRCYVYPIGSYAVAMDSRGLPATFIREYQVTVAQVIEQFGFPNDRPPSRGPDWSKFSEHVKNAWDNGNTEQPVDLCWMITTNPPQDRAGLKPWPFLSAHFEVGDDPFVGAAPGNPDEMLRESGFWEFPVLIPRWDVTGEDNYGTDSPGLTALGDARALQTLQKRKAQAIEKIVNPPMTGPAILKTQKVSSLPGDMTFVDIREGMQGIKPMHETQLRIAEILQDIQSHQFRIQRSFYEDLFLMLASSDGVRGAQPPTAREIDERHEEKLLALGPVLERTNEELLGPLVDRVYAMMDRAQLIPEPPPQLQGVRLRVEYISLMAQAQKLVGVTAADRFFLSVRGLAELYPDVRHKVDPMQAVEDYADQLGVNPALLRSADEAAALVQAEQEAVQAAQAAEVAKTTAQAAQAASAANLEGDTALRRAMGGVGP